MFPGFGPLLLTVKLAGLTTLILLVIGTPIAWWLANTKIKTNNTLVRIGILLVIKI